MSNDSATYADRITAFGLACTFAAIWFVATALSLLPGVDSPPAAAFFAFNTGIWVSAAALSKDDTR